MKFKCMLIASLMLAVLMVGAVSATDTISEDIVSVVDDDHLEITDNDVYTTGESSFSNLTDEIENTGTSLDLNQDYTFNNETDNKNGIVICKDNFVLNGNGCTIDGKNQSRIFNITANNVTLSNLILTGGNAEKGGAIYATGSLTLNNVTFTNNYAKIEGGAVGLYGNVILTCNNSDFIDNYAEAGSAIFVQKGVLNLYNADLSSKIFNRYSQIAVLANSIVYIENATFSNSNSSYSPALYLRSSKTSVINSKFINLRGNITSGAIGVRMGGDLYVKNCEFINTSSSKNAGAIFADVLYNDYDGVVTIIDTVFKDTSSGFGGAFLQLSGNLFLNNTKFINGHATYNGGSVYLSYVNGVISNCTFDSNGVDIIEGYPTYGGAILLDMGTYNISESKFFNNNASAGAAIYAYDSAYTISNSIFENNTNPIYTFFDKQSVIDETNIFINDNNISTNNTFFATIIIGEGMQLILSNNTINVTTLPTRYDSRDWRWTSSVKAQGWMGSCWTFGMTGVLESSLLKAAGITTDFSENNMQNTMLKYSIYGSPKIYEGGSNNYAVSYLLSWLGAFTQDADTYDEMGKISPLITTNQDIHVQDLMFIHNDEIPNGTHLKEAILKYGSVDVCYYGQSRYDEVSLFENTVPYNKNYQYDIVWGGAFVPGGNGNISYMNVFEALDDDLIAGVGTYFNSSGVNYKVQIYVNDELRLTQEGVSPFIGYHTIKLDEYIPIKKGDIFKAVMISDAMPGVDLRETRLHYDKNISFFSYDGQTWIDCYTEDAIACLKIYTVVDDTKIINNKDISVDYNGGKYFTVKVVTAGGHAVGAGAKVTFTINKKTKTVKTDKNGIAKIKITNVPKKYTITTKYMGKTYKNTVTVKHVLKTSKVTVKKTAKKFTLKATLKINGKLVKGKIIKFKFNGKTYKAKTNKKGIAQKILTKKVINKLKKGKTYTVKVTYLKDTIKTTVKVKK